MTALWPGWSEPDERTCFHGHPDECDCGPGWCDDCNLYRDECGCVDDDKEADDAA